jgi:hypothetical protein
MSETDQLILDAALYEDSVYVDNEFTDLDEWCQHTAEGEYESLDGDIVKAKINKMIELELITID